MPRPGSTATLTACWVNTAGGQRVQINPSCPPSRLPPQAGEGDTGSRCPPKGTSFGARASGMTEDQAIFTTILPTMPLLSMRSLAAGSSSKP